MVIGLVWIRASCTVLATLPRKRAKRVSKSVAGERGGIEEFVVGRALPCSASGFGWTGGFFRAGDGTAEVGVGMEIPRPSIGRSLL